MYPVRYRGGGLVVQPEIELAETLPDQAVKLIRGEFHPLVRRSHAQQLGHRIAPVIERKFTQPVPALVP